MKAPAELVAQYPAATEPNGKQNNPIYAAMLESLDRAVGRVLDALKEQGLDQNTLVIFTSDNGGLATREGANTPATVNAPLREGKGWLYEGGIRVPLLLKFPNRVPAGRENEFPTVTMDLHTTILDACKIPVPKGLEGISLIPIAQETYPPQPRSLYWHYPQYSNQGGSPGGVIRQENWKLITFYEHGRQELFDLKKDPRENKNVARDNPEIVGKLSTQFKAWQKQVGAKMPVENPDYHPNPQQKNGEVLLHSKTARVHGTQLRYEPLPHKETLGFWIIPTDWAQWDFEVEKPGEFVVEVLQGCGNNSGGSRVSLKVGDEKIEMEVEETGGFQKFVPRQVGKLKIAAGRQTLEIRALTKPGAAVMDVRQIRLIPAAAVNN